MKSVNILIALGLILASLTASAENETTCDPYLKSVRREADLNTKAFLKHFAQPTKIDDKSVEYGPLALIHLAKSFHAQSKNWEEFIQAQGSEAKVIDRGTFQRLNANELILCESSGLLPTEAFKPSQARQIGSCVTLNRKNGKIKTEPALIYPESQRDQDLDFYENASKLFDIGEENPGTSRKLEPELRFYFHMVETVIHVNSHDCEDYVRRKLGLDAKILAKKLSDPKQTTDVGLTQKTSITGQGAKSGRKAKNQATKRPTK